MAISYYSSGGESILKRRISLVFILGGLTAVVCASQTQTKKLPDLLTTDQAEAYVKQTRAQKEASKQARRKAALGKEAFEEHVLTRKDGRQILFRRVAPTEKVERKPRSASGATSPIPNFLAFQKAGEPMHESIHFSANVYGDQYSEIQWRDPEAQLQITVWTNINLNLLRPISAFEDDGVRYSYLGFLTHYSEAAEQARLTRAQEQGLEITSNWKIPPVVFSDEYYEYFVDAAWDAKIPEKLYRQLDALMGFYLSNYERLSIEHSNAAMLQAAREKDLKENPPVKPAQIIMNYTPLRGQAAE